MENSLNSRSFRSPIPGLWPWLGLSLVLHLLAFSVTRDIPVSIPPETPFLAVSLVAPESIETPTPRDEKRQVVSPSAAPTSPTPPQTPRTSDRDTFTPREQISRGSGAAPQEKPPATSVRRSNPSPTPEKRLAPSPSQREKVSSAVDAKAPTVSQAESRVPRLRLSEREISATLGSTEGRTASARISKSEAASKSEPARVDAHRRAQLQGYKPFRSASLSQLLRGSPGDPDFLPGIPDGDVTLLNAKADRFAVFVRRVALQVFGELRRRNWQHLPAREVDRVSRFVTVVATMNPKGELISVELINRSGSVPFDEVVREAAKAGTWDRNPPANAAAEDGNIHFIFESRTWGQFDSRTSSGRRWLLLAVGLR